jgi:hypothetical protein
MVTMKKIFIIALVLILGPVCHPYSLKAQVKGEPAKPFNPDTVFIFNSPRPLINPEGKNPLLRNAWGIDIIFSNNGFGAGFFYQYSLAKDLFTFASLYISGARNTDEIEYYDPNTNQYVVPNKVNRLYMFPLTFGLQQYILTNEISESLKLFVQGGVGPTYILSTPYAREFFNAFGYSTSYIRLASFLGAGADVGAGTTLISVNARYYYIPFGGKGLESIINLPIKDFGCLFLSLSMGVRF